MTAVATRAGEPGRISGPALLKIAIVKLSSLGDVIHALPVARALRRARPGLHLTWIVEAREYALLNGHPDLDVVVPVDTRLWRRLIWRPAGARQVLGKVRRLRSRVRAARFDVAIDLQGLMKSGLLTAYTGAPRAHRLHRRSLPRAPQLCSSPTGACARPRARCTWSTSTSRCSSPRAWPPARSSSTCRSPPRPSGGWRTSWASRA